MTQTKIQELVDEAIVLDRGISEDTERLKEIKKLLVAEAESRPEEHQDTDGGGSSIVFEGFDGCIARISFPAPSLKSSIDAEKPAGAKLMDMVGKWKDELFTPVLRYVPVESFRTRVSELFERREAGKIIKACQSDSAPRVSFETKETPVPQES